MYHIKDDKRSFDSAKRLYNALCQLVMLKPFDNISITELVETAEVARVTFYRNFDTLDDILLYELNRHFVDLKTYLNAYYSANPSYPKQIFILPFLNYWSQDTSLISLLLQCNRIHMLYDAFLSLFSDCLSNYYNESAFNINEYNYFLAIRSGIAINVLITWVKNGQKETPDEIMGILAKQIDGTMNFKMFGMPQIKI